MSFKLSDYNQYLYQECLAIAKNGNCKRRKVGAVLVFNPLEISSHYDGGLEEKDFSDTIISRGANQCLSLDESCEIRDCLVVNGHCERTVHAEINCIENSLIGAENKWLYISTSPCIKCFQILVKRKVKVIWYGNDDYWKMNPQYGNYIRDLAEKYGIRIGQI